MNRYPRPTAISRRAFTSSVLAGSVLLASPYLRRARAQEARQGGTLIASLIDTLPSLHPMARTTGNGWLVIANLYNTLTMLTPEGKVEPELAESWEANDRLDVWTFKLRPGVKFHNGTPLTASDVKATLDTLMQPHITARQYVAPIANVGALDDLTVRITLEAPTAELARQLAFASTKIISHKALENFDLLDSQPAGTGPFRMVSFTPNQELVMERNPDYFRGPVPLDRLIVRILPDATTQLAALRNREIDVICEVTGDVYSRGVALPGTSGMLAGGGTIYPIRVTRAQPPFDDIRVRRALAMALDRAGMVEALTHGTGTIGDDQPISDIYEFFSPGSGPITHDLDAARQLMQEAGYGGGASAKFVIASSGVDRRSQSELMQAMASQIGLELEVEMVDSLVFDQKYWGKPGVNSVGWYGARASIDAMLTLLLHTTEGTNDVQWGTPETDRMIESARATLDPQVRGKIYADLQQKLRDELPYIIPAFYRKMGLHNDYVQEVPFNGNQWDMRFEKSWMTEDAPQRM
ncbi:MAG: ABC transporter substrate-binding protein [Microbacterium sp.]